MVLTISFAASMTVPRETPRRSGREGVGEGVGLWYSGLGAIML
jgi:hypothetical protein